jgi:hypothetical protein
LLPNAPCCFLPNVSRNLRKRFVCPKQTQFFQKNGIHPLVHLTACLCRLAYSDSVQEDKNLEMAESTTNKSLKDFCKIMKLEFRHQYLNQCPSPGKVEQWMKIIAEKRDCKHFTWKNCPAAFVGQNKGKQESKKNSRFGGDC